MDNKLLNASCKIAFAALVHDVGKFTQRAKINFATKDLEEAAKEKYCTKVNNTFINEQAAYTALALEEIYLNLALPKKLTEPDDFIGKTNSDSILNLAAKYNTPQTFLQWIIATAVNVANGFERDDFDKDSNDIKKTGTNLNNDTTDRMFTLFEQVSLDGSKKIKKNTLAKRYPLKPMSVEALFPDDSKKVEKNLDDSVSDYLKLWRQFTDVKTIDSLYAIPKSQKDNLSLWLDSFDSAYLTYTHCIPSESAENIKADVSLYDHSKATAAFAVALWRWYQENNLDNDSSIAALQDRSAWDDEKLLIIQGDFFGIQNFVFSEGSQTNKQAAKILRGRSFYVSLLTELAALRVLETLELPATSQIMNAAGKFTIIAPNTKQTVNKLNALRAEFEKWFVDNTFATAGIGIQWLSATCAQFSNKQYRELNKKLYEQMDVAKLQRYNLSDNNAPEVMASDFSKEVCSWNGRLPADNEGKLPSCAMSRDQIALGKNLVSEHDVIMIFNTENQDQPIIYAEELNEVLNTKFQCTLPVFGYKVGFANIDNLDKELSLLVAQGGLRRCWDYSMPSKKNEILFHGTARRQINGYVPRYSNLETHEDLFDEDGEQIYKNMIKSFSYLASRDVTKNESGKKQGIKALTVLKGDIDNLGKIFQNGLCNDGNRSLSFAKVASMSRQINAFFTVYVPYLCKKDFPEIYTVFAGGDDFFFIGPWNNTQFLGQKMHEAFKAYVAENKDVHFSVGMSTVKSDTPVKTMAQFSEDALDEAKAIDRDKNAVTIFGRTVKWSDINEIYSIEKTFDSLLKEEVLSSSYIYSLFEIADLSQKEIEGSPEASIWRSRLYYKTARALERLKGANKKTKEQQLEVIKTVSDAIDKLRGNFRIPLTNLFYKIRQ